MRVENTQEGTNDILVTRVDRRDAKRPREGEVTGSRRVAPMAPLVPELIVLVELVPLLVIPQLFEQDVSSTQLQEVDELSGREGFEARHLVRQVVGGRNPVQMVLQDDVPEQLDPPFLLCTDSCRVKTGSQATTVQVMKCGRRISVSNR